MKNIILTALFLLPFVMISCQKEAIHNNPIAIEVTGQGASYKTLKTAFINPSVNRIAGDNPIKATGQGASDKSLKTLFINPTVSWIPGDLIGVYSDRAYTTYDLWLFPTGSPASNVAYGPYGLTEYGPIMRFGSNSEVYWDGTTNIHHFYAYYPYALYPYGQPWTAVPISLRADQFQNRYFTADDIGHLDFEVASVLALTPVVGGINPVVAFSFNHVFTLLKFDLTCSNANNLMQISLTKTAAPNVSLNTGSTIDISQPTPAVGVPYVITEASGGTPLNVTLTANMDLTSTIASAYMMILPGNHTGSANFTITFTSSGFKNFTIIKDGINFERGKVYTITQDIPVGGANGW